MELTTLIVTLLAAWIPPLLLGAVAFGSLRQKLIDTDKVVSGMRKTMDECNVLTLEQHQVLQEACQSKIHMEINYLRANMKELKDNVQADVKEIKQLVKESEAKRDEARSELMMALVELTKAVRNQ